MDTTMKTPSETGAWEVTPKRQKVAIVTGIGSGIGFAAAVALGREGFALIGVVRSERRAEETQVALEAAVPGAGEHLTLVSGDLSKRRDVLRLVEEVARILDQRFGGRLDRLLCSAGTVTSWYLATEDGYETQFAVNHLAVFQFGLGMRSRLEASGDGRLVVISSGSHYRTRIRWNDPMHRRLYNPLAAYKQSKLANVVEAVVAVTHRALTFRNPMKPFAVINVSSLAGFQPMPVKAVYAASKRFLLDLSVALGREMKRQGVTFTALCPAGMPSNPEVVRAIDRQGLLGQLTTMNVGTVASRTLDRAARGSSVYVPGPLNAFVGAVSRLVPPRWTAAWVGMRWERARARARAGESPYETTESAPPLTPVRAGGTAAASRRRYAGTPG